ncbi:YciI family protein [Saccharospirillum alexandrii]|uniref:YciI family protein n=1 Tax=Saccharospirillum alexandrii TaxID=2448477 RepID=UPI003735A9E4
MRFIVRTFDDPTRIEVRAEHMQLHLNYLAENEQEILVAGSLRESTSDGPIGALWIIEAESEGRARELVEGDPFFRKGLRQKYELLYWSKAFSHTATV